MAEGNMALLGVFLVAALVVGVLLYTPIHRYRRNRTLAERPFPAPWRRWLINAWWLYPHLPMAVRERLEAQLQVMMANTTFYGCNGLEVTDSMRVLTLAQAALMHSGGGNMRWAEFPVVLLYPDAFVREVDVTDDAGVVVHERQALLGESWEQGRVVLSWADIEKDLRGESAHSLVVHEYAHQWDGRDGVMDGTPPVLDSNALARWERVMQGAYRDLCDRVERSPAVPEIPLDPYAATNPEEFFAVISEYFFTDPWALLSVYPDVYDCLKRLYQLDTSSWPVMKGSSGLH
ncbi:zinc-dependent peptidase [Marinimicrobium sp. ARAG 43.8]|uniref:M90 family metallopeptidase n=1 Tax=Marinimicrobium sp. ARAG 43.8 TaxID=3418719 RepID=UPI003CEDB89D